MTPKEKARELVDRYYWVFGDGYLGSQHIQCALIAVDEIIKANPIIPLEFMLESEALDAANEYWTEVKQEIEKL